jgi:kynureninase
VIVDVPDFPAVHRELTERQVLCDFRPDSGIRLGPHYYNTDDEIRFVVEQIGEILRTGAHEQHFGIMAQH